MKYAGTTASSALVARIIDAKNAANSAQAMANRAYWSSRYYGVCTTDANNGAKIVEIGDFALEHGARVSVLFTQPSYSEYVSFNVGGTGAVPGFYRSAENRFAGAWNAYELVELVYDGYHWILNKQPNNWLWQTVIPTTGWIEQGGAHYLNIGVGGIREVDYPIIDVVLSADTSAAKLQLAAWACVTRILTFDNLIQVWCNDSLPTTEITISLLVPKIQ